VIVYAGAIVVLFLFVIMLLGVDKEEIVAAEPMQSQAIVAAVVMVITLAEIWLLGHGHWATGTKSVVGALEGPGGNVQQLAEVIFTRYLFAFEATSVLLVIAVVAAVSLARRPEGDDVDAELVAASAAEDAARLATNEAIAELEMEEESAEAEEVSS
jgi:NADH-quinone oxidoreductase subunit J